MIGLLTGGATHGGDSGAVSVCGVDKDANTVWLSLCLLKGVFSSLELRLYLSSAFSGADMIFKQKENKEQKTCKREAK